MKINYIYKPVIFLFLFFVADKIFLLPYFKKEFVQSGNVVYYRQREMLLDRLQKRKSDKKLILAFGDSRAYAFSDLSLNDKLKEQWELYNFSAPQAAPVYSLFMLEKMIQNGVVPNAIFLVISPEGFDDKKGLIHSPFMKFGADINFIQKYWSDFPAKDRREFMMDNLFAVAGVEFDINLLLSRLLSGELNQYNKIYNKNIMVLNLYKGESLGYVTPFNDITQLKKKSSQLKSIYLRNFQLDNTQFYFLEKFYQLAAKNKIQVISIWPKVYSEYKDALNELDLENKWWQRINLLSEKYGMASLDFNRIVKCDLFYDASHQSAQCIQEETEDLIKHYIKSEIE